MMNDRLKLQCLGVKIELTGTDLDKRGLSFLVGEGRGEGTCVRLGLLLLEWLACRTPLIRVLGVSPSIIPAESKNFACNLIINNDSCLFTFKCFEF